MQDNTLVKSSFSTTINAPIEKVDIPPWRFTLPDMEFLGKQGIPFENFQTARKPISEAHNRLEALHYAKSIERHALRRK